jgi:hypothetical protein
MLVLSGKGAILPSQADGSMPLSPLINLYPHYRLSFVSKGHSHEKKFGEISALNYSLYQHKGPATYFNLFKSPLKKVTNF